MTPAKDSMIKSFVLQHWVAGDRSFRVIQALGLNYGLILTRDDIARVVKDYIDASHECRTLRKLHG